MIGRSAIRDFILAHHKTSVPRAEMPGTSLNLQEFIKGMTCALNEVNNALTQSKFTGVYYSEDFMQRYHPNYSSLDTDGITNPHFFQIHEENYFRALPHCLPSEALSAFFRGPTFADCGSVLQACIYRSLEGMVGTEDFNKAFKNNSSPFLITTILHAPIPHPSNSEPVDLIRKKGNPIFFLFDLRIINKDSDADVCIGDIIYIKGVDGYAMKHSEGASGGWNVICVGKNNHQENLYLGFGPSLFQTPKTYAEIKRRLINDYNAPPSAYSKNSGGISSRLLVNDKVDQNYSIKGITGCLSLNLTRVYNFIFEALPSWHSMTMLQLACNNPHPEPNILSSLFTVDDMDHHIRTLLRKFTFSITGSSLPRGLFLGDVFPPQSNYLLPVMSYLKQQKKKIAELNSNLVSALRNQNILTGVNWIDKNAMIPHTLLDPQADVFIFDNLDFTQSDVRFLIKKVLSYVLHNNAAILVYSKQPIPALSDLMPEHLDYNDWRGNNFLRLQTRDDVCKYFKVEPPVTIAKPSVSQ